MAKTLANSHQNLNKLNDERLRVGGNANASDSCDPRQLSFSLYAVMPAEMWEAEGTSQGPQLRRSPQHKRGPQSNEDPYAVVLFWKANTQREHLIFLFQRSTALLATILDITG